MAEDAGYVSPGRWWELPEGLAAVAYGRKLACAALEEWGLTAATAEVELLVNELVTNAVVYGRAPIRLRLRVVGGGGLLLGEVSDGNRALPRRRHPTPDDEGGRGISMIAAIAVAYGWYAQGGGKTVWFTHAVATNT